MGTVESTYVYGGIITTTGTNVKQDIKSELIIAQRGWIKARKRLRT